MIIKSFLTACIIMFAVSFMFCGCKNSSSSKDWGMKYAEQLCSKMEECSKEKMKKIPENMRAQMMSRMPNKEQCIAQAKKKHDAKGEKKYTDEQIELIKQCMDEMIKIPCSDMRALANLQKSESCKKVAEFEK